MLRTGNFRIWTAVSRMAATPEPLSLMPGPAGTLSRCAPTITMLFAFPLRVVASTLWSVPSVSVESTLSRTVVPGVLASSLPTAKSAKTIGMSARHSPMSTGNASVRPG